MSKKIKYAYCKICKHEVDKPVKKLMTTSQKIGWIMACVATLGIAAIALVIIQSRKPKNYCPDCYSKLEFSDEPFEKPKKKLEDMTPREKVLEKVGVAEDIEEEQKTKKDKTKKSKKGKEIFCPYCGEKLDEKYATCPFCQSVLEF